jgi:hypothetical protein
MWGGGLAKFISLGRRGITKPENPCRLNTSVERYDPNLIKYADIKTIFLVTTGILQKRTIKLHEAQSVFSS